jgi:hypothetical protein
VSGCSSGKCIIWDLNRLCYVRSLRHHRAPVTCIAVSPHTGDIVTVDCDNTTEVGCVSTLCLWSINGELLATTTCNDKINCVAVTGGTEGISRNVVVGGLAGGSVRMWDAFDLRFVHELREDAMSAKSPVTALCFSPDYTQLTAGHANGAVIAWSSRRQSMSNPSALIRTLTRTRRAARAAVMEKNEGQMTKELEISKEAQLKRREIEGKQSLGEVGERKDGGENEEVEQEEEKEEGEELEDDTKKEGDDEVKGLDEEEETEVMMLEDDPGQPVEEKEKGKEKVAKTDDNQDEENGRQVIAAALESDENDEEKEEEIVVDDDDKDE